MPLTDMRLTDFVCSNYSKIFSNCGVDLYTGNTFNDAISCLKMCIDLYTRLIYTRVYTVYTVGRDEIFVKSSLHDALC